MILCKSCGYEGVYEGRACPQCRELFSLSAEEIAAMEEDLRAASAEGAHETAAELTHILADAGRPVAAAAYGRMLYEGDGVVENKTEALSYLSVAAKAGDSKGAFAYGKALSERGDAEGDFFLLYSALLGYSEAYEAAAAVFHSLGREEAAIAYLALASASGSRSASLSLARRYEKGEGVEENAALAKWYLSRVTPLPPHAWPMALRLRHTVATEPPAPAVPHVAALISELYRQAEKQGYKKICLSLCQMLATRGDADAQCRLGELYLQGYAGEVDGEKGREVLLHYARRGNAAAYLLLGDLYRVGRGGIAPSRTEAVAFYNAAKALGSSDACIRLGDIYASSENAPNVPYAYILYKEALALGSREGADKAHAIEERREALYAKGKEMLATDAEDAYRNFALAASMGYAPAAVALGFCYEEGLGVVMDRRRAFLWYESAAKEKEAMAEYRLGRCYLHGIGIDRCFKEAHALLRRAAAAGVEDARCDLFSMLERRRSKLLRSLYSMGMRLLYQGKYEAARSVMEQASSLGFARATYALGCFHEFGVGGAVNRDLAYATYRTAEAQGFVDTRSKCKSVILKMLHYHKQESDALLAK